MKKKANTKRGVRREGQADTNGQIDRDQMVDFFLKFGNSLRDVVNLVPNEPPFPPIDRDNVDEFLSFLETSASEPPFVTKGKTTEWSAPCDDLEPTIEYALPIEVGELRKEHRELLTPWIQRFLGSDPQEVRTILMREWEAINSPAFRKFTSFLGTLTPRSLVFAYDQKWLLFWNPNRENSWIMIHEPKELTSEESDFLSGFGNPDLPHFCRHFQHSFDAPYPYDNGFSLYPTPASENTLGKLGSWLGGLHLYHICTGDAIILGLNGEVGRWYHEIGWEDTPGLDRPVAVEKYADSFAEFIDLYLSYRSSGADQQLFR